MNDPNHSEPSVPPITIPAASTDQLLHALSATVIAQHATITLMSGLLLQVYCTVNQMPMEEGLALHDRLFGSHVTAANEAFIASIQERQQHLQPLFDQ